MDDPRFLRRLVRAGISLSSYLLEQQINPLGAARIEYALQPVKQHINPMHPRRFRKTLDVSARQFKKIRRANRMTNTEGVVA